MANAQWLISQFIYRFNHLIHHLLFFQEANGNVCKKVLTMKRLIHLLPLVIFAVACEKDPASPPPSQQPIRYTDLKDTAIRLKRSAVFDLTGDGQWDVFFGTLMVGDPLEEVDKWQWLVGSHFDANLPVNEDENIPMLQKNNEIPINNFSGYTWFNASMVYLTQKIIGTNVPPVWQGEWKNANHHFIPIQVMKNGGLYNGWVEVSFDTTGEKLIVHKSGISNIPGVAVKAGI